MLGINRLWDKLVFCTEDVGSHHSDDGRQLEKGVRGKHYDSHSNRVLLFFTRDIFENLRITQNLFFYLKLKKDIMERCMGKSRA